MYSMVTIVECCSNVAKSRPKTFSALKKKKGDDTWVITTSPCIP